MALVKLTGPATALLHTVRLAGVFITAVGFTVMVNVRGVPVQPFADGVTVIVAVTGAVPVLVAVKLAILPVPLAPRPIVVLLLVQLYTVPATAPLNVTAAVGEPLHTTWFATALTVGVGFTVIVKVSEVPAQVIPPFVNCGITVIVAVIGAVVGF